jgi:L-asparagine oxygenase
LLSEFWLSVFGLVLGCPVAFADQQAGALIQNVSPIPGCEADESDVGSSRPLPFHTENPFHELAPDFLLLVCLRSDESSVASTTLAQVKDIVSRLDRDVVSTLREPSFIERGTTNTPKAVLTGPSDDPCIRFDATWTQAVNEAGTDALVALLAELARSSQAVRLAAGDLLLIDNRRWLHGRTRFNASGEASERWLQRLYVCEHNALVEALVSQGVVLVSPRGDDRGAAGHCGPMPGD